MRIALSKGHANKPRHVVVLLEQEEFNRYRIFIYNRILKGEVRPVVNYDAVKQLWRYRFHLRYLDEILMAFPTAEMSPALHRRIVKRARREIQQQEVPDIEVPGLWDYKNDAPFELFGYQKIGIARMVEGLGSPLTALDDKAETTEGAQGVFINNDEMGLGKTIQAAATVAIISAAAMRGEKVLVVCPSNARYVWEREIRTKTKLKVQVVNGTFPEREHQIKKRTQVTVVNFETIRANYINARQTALGIKPKHPSLFNYEYGLLIVDEFHRCRNPLAQQTIGYMHLPAARVLPMSGTPIMSRIEEIWPTLHRLWPERFPDFQMFCRAIGVYQGKKLVGYDPSTVTALKEFLEPVTIRRRKDQVFDDLPSEMYVQKPIELTREQRRIYNRIRDEFIVELDSGEQKKIKFVLHWITRLKQACFSPELFDGSKHSAKIDELREDVRELIESGEKAILYSQWAKAARILQREFAQYNPAYVDGSVVDTKRNQARMAQVDRFNNDDECRLYIGTIGANKEAITLSAATYVAFADKDWLPGNNRQAALRSAAGGLRGLHSTASTITILEYLGADTYEERIEEVLAEKQGIFNGFVEKDGGMLVSRSVIQDIRELI